MSWASLFLFAIAMLFIVTAFNQVQEWSLLSIEFCTVLGVGIIALISFYLYERRIAHPLIDINLLTNKDFQKGLWSRLFYMYGWTMMLFVIPIYLQNILGYSPYASGLWMLLMTGMFGLGSPFIGKIMDRLGYRPPIIASMITAGISYSLLLFFDGAIVPLAIALLIYGVSTALNIPPTTNAIVSSVSKENQSLAIGLIFTISFLISSLSIALNGFQLNIVSSFTLANKLASANIKIPETVLEPAVHGSQSIGQVIAEFSPDIQPTLAMITQESFSAGMASLLYLNLFLVCCGFFLSLRLKKFK